ncbi:MAG: hypothetical protein WBM94_12805, partial [Eudoraea sp.]
MMLPFFGITQDAIIDLENILIRNVTVIDQERKSEDVVVSILIKQGKLNLVTKDQIALSKDDIAFDATGGFIFGELEVGKPAGFIILDQDPRINVDIILDTKSYAIFAVSKGKVILNTMVRIDDDDMQGQLSGWESYTSPPLALPLSYQNNRKWNVFRTKPVTAVLGGAILMENTRWFSDDPVNEQQVGDLSEFKGGSVRGFRAGLGGTFNFKKPWSYLFTFGTRAFERGFSEDDMSEFVLYDYRVDIPLGSASLSVGKTRETISISRLSSLIY